jgi:hypothetical protein
MDHQLKRLLNLVRRTGDRLVVTDPNGEDTYVLMGLEAYENLTDRLSPNDFKPFDHDGFDGPRKDFLDDYYDEDENYDSEELAEDFDPDWKIPDEFLVKPSVSSSPQINEKTIWDTMPPAGDKSETWNPEKLNEEEKKIVEEKFKKSEDEPGEEQFYLEPIE